VTIPALEPVSESSGLLPGAASRLTAYLDDTAGSGLAIPLNITDSYGVEWRLGSLEGWDAPDLEEGADKRSGSDDCANPFHGVLPCVFPLEEEHPTPRRPVQRTGVQITGETAMFLPSFH